MKKHTRYLLLILPLAGCSMVEYDCPLDDETGACASQMTAYMTSLHTNTPQGDSIYGQGMYASPNSKQYTSLSTQGSYYDDPWVNNQSAGSNGNGNANGNGSAQSGTQSVEGKLPFSQVQYDSYDENTDFLYRPAQIYRTWIAANVVEDAVVGNHHIYWVADEGGWDAPSIASGQGSDILRPHQQATDYDFYDNDFGWE